ncbi:MAG: zinc ABC transporter substrate-binding protein [Hyphomicrobiaceae bacterium]|nr:zinc ABC transporter substrate-binding protein [Hyphomicrobiaceae bacterium]
MTSATALSRWSFGLLATAAVLPIIAAQLSPAAAAGELKVVATIKPIHSLVAQVMEGIGKPALLVDGKASPHSFSLKPSDARALNSADVVFRVSPSLEPFTIKVAEALPKSVTLVTLSEAQGVALLDTRTSATFEAHEHGEGHDAHGKESHGKGPAEHSGHDDHDGHDDDDEHAHGGKDGHIWLDPENARAIVRAAATALAARAPDLAGKLEANAAAAIARIDALDAELKSSVAGLAGKPFIVFHDAYQYFERRYGLGAAGSITLNPEVKPSAKRLTAIRAKVQKLGATCVFAEPQFSPRIVASVIEGSAARSGELDPEGASIPNGPELYPTLMRNLARSLNDCLAPRS